MTTTEHLYAASEAGSIIAIATNPIWLIKTRLFTTKKHESNSYRGLFHGIYMIGKTEGIKGYWKGTFLALFGVVQGAIQFAVYEELKIWRSRQVDSISNHNNQSLSWLVSVSVNLVNNFF